MENTLEFLKHTKIDNHAIKLKKNKQLRFSLIYSLELVELKILKSYIKINLAKNFIQIFKFLAKVFILFN